MTNIDDLTPPTLTQDSFEWFTEYGKWGANTARGLLLFSDSLSDDLMQLNVEVKIINEKKPDHMDRPTETLISYPIDKYINKWEIFVQAGMQFLQDRYDRIVL